MTTLLDHEWAAPEFSRDEWSEMAADTVRLMDDRQVSLAAGDVDMAVMVMREVLPGLALEGEALEDLAGDVRDTCRGLGGLTFPD